MIGLNRIPFTVFFVVFLMKRPERDRSSTRAEGFFADPHSSFHRSFIGILLWFKKRKRKENSRRIVISVVSRFRVSMFYKRGAFHQNSSNIAHLSRNKKRNWENTLIKFQRKKITDSLSFPKRKTGEMQKRTNWKLPDIWKIPTLKGFEVHCNKFKKKRILSCDSLVQTLNINT